MGSSSGFKQQLVLFFFKKKRLSSSMKKYVKGRVSNNFTSTDKSWPFSSQRSEKQNNEERGTERPGWWWSCPRSTAIHHMWLFRVSVIMIQSWWRFFLSFTTSHYQHVDVQVHIFTDQVLSTQSSLKISIIHWQQLIPFSGYLLLKLNMH